MSDQNTYFIDKDSDAELARLQVQDEAYSLEIDLLPKGFTSTSNTRILDLACGPGGWALQVSHAYPDMSVIGVDLSEQMIVYARAQAEARELTTQFRIMDILRVPWPFPDASFDLVNARFITSLTPKAFLPYLYQECLRVLQPGGIIRYTEGVYNSTPTSFANHQLDMIACEATYKAGLSFSPYEMGTSAVVGRLLKQTGFENMTLTPYVVDLSHGAPLHDLMRENWLIALSLLEPFVLKMNVCSHEEFKALQENLIRDWSAEDFCAHYHLCSLTGRKPV